MRLNQTLQNVFRDAGISDMATTDIDKLTEFSIGNFKNFKKDEPLRGFYAGGATHRGTGPGGYSGTSTSTYSGKYRPNYGYIKDGKVVYDKGFLGGSFDAVSRYASQATDWLADSWLWKGVKTGYNWIKGESGQKFIDNLRQRWQDGKLVAGGGGGGGQQQIGGFSSGAARANLPAATFTAGDPNAKGSTPLTQTLANAVSNPEFNPYGASYVASQAIKVSALNLPDINTELTLRSKQYVQPPQQSVTV